jgi:hypothetical protein
MDTPKAGQQPQKRVEETLKKPAVRAAIALGAVILLVVVIVLISSGGESSGGESGGAEIVSADALREDVAGGEAPVYWAGERRGTEIELSQPGGGRTFVRYLSGGAEAGDPHPNFLTVGTYAVANPVSALRKLGKRPGGVVGSAPGHAIVYFNKVEPHSVFLAYPGVEVEIEVYDPDFTHALQLVNSGQIVAVG